MNSPYPSSPPCRLLGSNKGSGTAVFSYVYDRFGNRWQQNGPNSFIATFTGNNPSNPQNNNRIDGYSYDAAGNLLNDGVHNYTYDAESRITQVDAGATAIYTYNALGQRVEKTTPAFSNECGTSSPSGTVFYLYDLSGHTAVYTADGTNSCMDDIFAAGRHLATYAGDTIFNHSDWLGTERVRRYYANHVTETCTSNPFGDALSCTSSPTNTSPLHFTGKQRDFESGLDNFGARYDSSSMGRFMSPDPLGGHQEDPQTLNKYVSVRNNPLNLTDPTGLDFNLTCSTKENTPTCQGGLQGTTTTTTDANGKQTSTFTATVISNDKNGNLVDQNGNKYNGTVDGTGVQFSQQGSNTSSNGIWVNGSPETKFTQTSGALAGFSFDFHQTSKEQTANGTFYYPGAPRDAYEAVLKAGFSASMADDFFNPLHGYIGSYHYRSDGDPGTGKNSGHLIIRGVGILHPWDTVPAKGELHFGETNPNVNRIEHFRKDVF
jgi:RHS repeat-associated protein